MPFCKRIIAPKDVCKSALRSSGAPFADLADVCGYSLCSILRQLSDLCRQSVSILEELEGEITFICHRSGTLEKKVLGLQRHVSALASSKPPLRTTTNLDSESKRTAHFQSSWQQHVNVFGSWSRPECVQELHQEAQLNLQSLLQDFEEQLYDNRVTGQTFRHPSSQSSEDTSTTLSQSPSSHNKKPEFVFLPANKQVCEDETTSLGIRAQDPAACGSDRSLLGWNSSVGPPIAEKPCWHLNRHSSAHLVPIDVTGDGKILAVDLIQGACSPDFSQPRSLEPTTEHTGEQHIPLRKTQSDLEHSIPVSPKMDHATLMCPSPSWNGPKGSTFSPSWNDSYNYGLTPNQVAKHPLSKPGMLSPNTGGGNLICPSQTISGMSISSGSHTSSFTSISDPSGHTAHGVTHNNVIYVKKNETDGSALNQGTGNGLNCEQERRSARSNAFMFRERSLSTPTDSLSLCSTDNLCCPVESVPAVREVESYALLYPSNSSEDNTSTDNVSVTAGSDYFPQSRLRSRSRSISLKKQKKKPPPPVRSVSLVKNLSEAGGIGLHHREGHIRDGRPKSLYIPRDHNLQDSFQPQFLMAARPDEDTHSSLETASDNTPQALYREGDLAFPPHWQLNEWKSNNDPYRSLSGSSTATGTTVIECIKVRGSTESLNSPSTSRATSPSPLSIEAETKVFPYRPPCLMSPSSGYSSQSETPTPTIANNAITGPTPAGCKMRPKIPERKSSLPATSPKEKARSRLSFELPVNSQVDLSSVRPKPKANRRHSDTSTTNKPGKPGSSQSSQPTVTTTDLRNIRLRSVSRSELEDSPDGSSDIIEEEQGRDISPPVTPCSSKPPKPPVAVKPPLPKRPMNLVLKSPTSSPQAYESPPSSPVNRPMPVGNIYMVVKKPKPKRSPQSSANPSAVRPQEKSNHPPTYPELDLEHGIPIEEDFMFLRNPEIEDNTYKTFPSPSAIFCPAEFDKKKPKVPPPVPKKPNVLLLPSPTSQVPSNGTTERQGFLLDSGSQSPLGPPPSEAEEASYHEDDQETPVDKENHEGTKSHVQHENQGHVEALENQQSYGAPEDSFPTETEYNQDKQAFPAEVVTETPLEENCAASDKMELHISEETDDDVLVQTPSTHTTEDLFTIIHRSKRKVLGRKEPVDSFGSRQNLVSPVKSSGSDIRTLTLGSTPRSSSRNENFMALLQKKSNKSSSGTRVSAMELLKSTNPLARRVTEFTQSDSDA
ncbi:NHS-like protein 2 isoform X1 [Trichomycterus rosablanca]|uniref:NHS-like protein 2 isoform X1 n=1 Tax=Trichomycterus rosablanca TaxID=2290929 RepID=UPI002F35A8C2